MTRKLPITENQIRTILRAARKEGVRVEIRIGDVVVSALPEGGDPRQELEPEIFRL